MFKARLQRFRLSRRTGALRSHGVSPEDALSIGEIAKLYGVSVMTAHRYTRRDGFPEPLAKTSGGRVWLRKEVARWGRDHLPLQTGRPPKQEG